MAAVYVCFIAGLSAVGAVVADARLVGPADVRGAVLVLEARKIQAASVAWPAAVRAKLAERTVEYTVIA
jgi:hypothetical protein